MYLCGYSSRPSPKSNWTKPLETPHTLILFFFLSVCFCALVRRSLWWVTSTLFDCDIHHTFHRGWMESLWAVLVVRGAWSWSLLWVDLWMRYMGRCIIEKRGSSRRSSSFIPTSPQCMSVRNTICIQNCGFLLSSLHGFFKQTLYKDLCAFILHWDKSKKNSEEFSWVWILQSTKSKLANTPLYLPSARFIPGKVSCY